MPTYQYQCTSCGHRLEEFQSITEPPLVLCPQCNTENLVRVIGAGAGVIFKGTGFYLTDYKKRSSASPPSTKETKTAPKEDSSSSGAEKTPKPPSS
jgi:putative FmdB family regulatory protein